MTPFECYKEYTALKNHFSGERGYDYFKYNGKMRLNQKSFDNRNDKIFFMKIAKHDDPRGFIVANLLDNPKSWIKELAYSERAEKNYVDWKKRQQSLMYSFNSEICKLDDDFNSNFTVKDNTHPKLLRLYLQKEISLETLVMIVKATNCLNHWNKKMKYDPVWLDISTKITRYMPFLKYDTEKVVDTIIERFADGKDDQT